MTTAEPTTPPHVSPYLLRPLLACAKFLGWQEDGEGGWIPLWNLTRGIAGHVAGSTLFQATIERALLADDGNRFDEIAETKTEGRTRDPRRVNFHD